MSNVIKIFENEEFGRVRTIIKDGSLGAKIDVALLKA